ncbi:MAG: hypothetical protein ACOC1K_00480 [Nanoarchaeota archaeon]
MTKNKNSQIFDIFDMFNSPSYIIEKPSDEQIKLYKLAFKEFKNKEINKESKASIMLDIDSDNIILKNFSHVEMYRFGYEVAKAELI